ncbi:MAG: LamG-like jellyroll fold domain-containing protein [Methylotetracoccus sp.]
MFCTTFVRNIRVATAGCVVTFSMPSVAGDVVLWNKLGSEYEVTHSEIGPNGTIVGNSFAFEPVQFGNGYVRKASGDNYVIFPRSLLSGIRRRGSMALWITPKVTSPVPFQYGVFGFVSAPYTNLEVNFGLWWGDTVTNKGLTVIVYSDLPAVYAEEPAQFFATPGLPFHVAMSWDLDGIEGTTDTLRAYRDGKLVASTSGKWNPNFSGGDIFLGVSPDAGGYDKFVTDNLVIWDYAKTDFSDRYSESPSINSAAFSVFAPQANVHLGPKPDDDRFEYQASFSPDITKGDGIDPTNENVSFKLGQLSMNIPAGSFKPDGSGGFTFNGTINKIPVEASIAQQNAPARGQAAPMWATDPSYRFFATGSEANLDGTLVPEPASLTIGDDFASGTLTVGNATLTAVADCTSASTSTALCLSTSPNRSSPASLDGATVSGLVYVFAQPYRGVKQVKFWLGNDPTLAPTKVEKTAPFDFAGTAPNGAAYAFDTSRLSKGRHAISAQVIMDNGITHDIIKGTFTVR